MNYENLTFSKASELLISAGYTLLSKVNFSYAYYHPNSPRQKVIVIPSNTERYSRELSSRIYDAVNICNSKKEYGDE